jgi:hypothetical protein
MTRAAATRISETADALLDWLRTQQRAVTAEPPTPADAAGPAEASAESAPAADTSPADRPQPDDHVRTAPTATSRHEQNAARAAPLRLNHTDWLHHRLTIAGPDAPLTAFRQAAAGAGIIPWQLDLDRVEEDMFHLLVAPPRQPRTLSFAGAGIVAGQLREAVGRRHDLAVARVGTSRACPFDLHALLPVPADVLRLGPDHPDALGWLWQNWGTTHALRHVSEQAADGEPPPAPGEVAWQLTGRRTGRRGGRWQHSLCAGQRCGSTRCRRTPSDDRSRGQRDRGAGDRCGRCLGRQAARGTVRRRAGPVG